MPARRVRLLSWYAGSLLVFFAVPYVGADLAGLHHDLYLLVYFTVALTFLASYVAHVGVEWREWLSSRAWWSLGVGAAVAIAIVRNVMSEASMPHPSGAFLVFEVVWRGVAYGVVDALVLFTFPASVAYLLLGEQERRRRLRLAALTLALSMGVTATYHLGYPQFRDSDLAQPEIGALVANVPMAVTGNPVGALVVHGSYHVAANVHTYRSEIYLPPDLEGYPERGSGTAGPALAIGWVLLAGAAVYVARERLFPTRASGR